MLKLESVVIDSIDRGQKNKRKLRVSPPMRASELKQQEGLSIYPSCNHWIVCVELVMQDSNIVVKGYQSFRKKGEAESAYATINELCV